MTVRAPAITSKPVADPPPVAGSCWIGAVVVVGATTAVDPPGVTGAAAGLIPTPGTGVRLATVSTGALLGAVAAAGEIVGGAVVVVDVVVLVVVVVVSATTPVWASTSIMFGCGG